MLAVRAVVSLVTLPVPFDHPMASMAFDGPCYELLVALGVASLSLDRSRPAILWVVLGSAALMTTFAVAQMPDPGAVSQALGGLVAAGGAGFALVQWPTGGSAGSPPSVG